MPQYSGVIELFNSQWGVVGRVVHSYGAHKNWPCYIGQHGQLLPQPQSAAKHSAGPAPITLKATHTSARDIPASGPGKRYLAPRPFTPPDCLTYTELLEYPLSMR
jgi:hypothetical protein